MALKTIFNSDHWVNFSLRDLNPSPNKDDQTFRHKNGAKVSAKSTFHGHLTAVGGFEPRPADCKAGEQQLRWSLGISDVPQEANVAMKIVEVFNSQVKSFIQSRRLSSSKPGSSSANIYNPPGNRSAQIEECCFVLLLNTLRFSK